MCGSSFDLRIFRFAVANFGTVLGTLLIQYEAITRIYSLQSRPIRTERHFLLATTKVCSKMSLESILYNFFFVLWVAMLHLYILPCRVHSVFAIHSIGPMADGGKGHYSAMPLAIASAR